MSAREADPLAYAFSTDGWLDPGTKLLDVGLDGYTPTAALHTLVDEPLHMSVALHEVTHFVSLENTLGHVMGFLAMRAKTIAEALAEHGQGATPIEPTWIALFAAWHGRYRLLLELWRPLLEGLAIYAQTHRPNLDGDALIEPVALLWHWKLVCIALGEIQVARPGLTLDQLDGGFLQAAYRAIQQGPRLRQGERTLAAGLELLDPEQLRPYFLGHAYLRALQRAMADACADYRSNELFFQTVLRILRSSTRQLLMEKLRWDHPSIARCIYGWLETVRQAPASRVAALRKQPDAIDVLHFLATGEEKRGYAGTMREDVAVLRDVIPEFWEDFESELGRRHAHDIDSAVGDREPGGDATEVAQRLAGAWMRGAMTLNLSSRGRAWVAGWIPNGLAPLHTLALDVDGALWWLAASDADIDLLAGPPAELPQLPRHALLDAFEASATTHEVLIDCYIRYEPDAGATRKDEESATMRPVLRFELAPARDPARSLLTELAPARSGVARSHLRVAADDEHRDLHYSSMQMRLIVHDALEPAELVALFDRLGHADAAEAMRKAVGDEERAAARVRAQVERRILGSLLGRPPSGEDLALLERGVGAVKGAAAFEDLIAAAYALPLAADEPVIEAVCAINKRSQAAFGKALFEVDKTKSTVCYQGLWGNGVAT